MLIGSFSPVRRTAAVRMLPGVATSISARGAVAAVAAARAGSLRSLRRILRDVQAVQLPVSVLRMRAFTPRTIAAFHAAGVEVHAWTINDPPQISNTLLWGGGGGGGACADDRLCYRHAGGHENPEEPKPVLVEPVDPAP